MPRPPRWLLAVVLLFALAEVVVLVQFAHRFGGGWTAAVIAGSAALGMVLLARLGSRPGQRGFDLLCALMFLVPGLLSSLLAAVLLIPAVRAAVRARWLRWARDHGLVAGTGPGTVIVMEPLESSDAPLRDDDEPGDPDEDRDEDPGGR